MHFTTRMSSKELKKAEIIARVMAKELSSVGAASLLGVTDRTVRRLKNIVRLGGSDALAHRTRGRVGNHRIPLKERKRIEELLVSRYHDFTQTFAAEKLAEIHGFDRDPKTIGRIMVELGLKEPKRTAQAVTHRHWREPRASFGELVQFDGSYHHWFEDRGGTGELCLLAAIDDASGRVLSLSFREHEGVLPVLGFWKEYALQYGLPQGIYVDKFSTYKMNQETILENPDVKTQFARVMENLRVSVVFANSSQAKGRVERLFKTLQDRLVKELRLQGISTVEKANRFLTDVFVSDFNRRFARLPRETGDLHRPLTVQERHRIDNLFCREDERVVQHDFTISHEAIWYQMLATPGIAIRPRDSAIVRTHVDHQVSIAIRGRTTSFKIVPKHIRRTQAPTKPPRRLSTLVPTSSLKTGHF